MAMHECVSWLTKCTDRTEIPAKQQLMGVSIELQIKVLELARVLLITAAVASLEAVMGCDEGSDLDGADFSEQES
jgi:hypothetical protein